MASPVDSNPLFQSTRGSTAHPRSTKHCPSLNRKYKTTCVTTKQSLVVLLWSAVINAVGFAPVLYIITAPVFLRITTGTIPVLIYYMLGLLMYPLAGFVGDVLFTRFNLMTTGSLMVLIGGFSFTGSIPASDLINITNDTLNFVDHKLYLLYLPLLLIVPGIGLFQANVLQYGTDQLDFASSEVTSSFVHWYYWTCYVFFAIGSLSFYRLHIFSTYFFICTTGLFFLIVTVAFAIGCCSYNRSLRADPGHQVNPVKLIWRVMQFVRKHKYPLRRSAFTYNEWPSRLDLAKQRYGGPFTTEEVEDVKSFWRILLVMISLIGFQFRDDTMYVRALHFTFWEEFYGVVESTWTISALVVVVIIPIYQFIIRPCFPACIPKMVTKMLLGLLLTLVSLAFTTVYSELLVSYVYQNVQKFNSTDYCDPNTTQTFKISELCHCLDGNNPQFHGYKINKSNFSSYWLAIPQAFSGLSHMLVFLTALEFILAQAPRIFQGFLIGLWYAMQSVSLGVTIIGYGSCAVFYWEYYAAKTLIILLSTVLFVIAAHKYKYRQLNEDADVNIQQQIEQIFERNFDREVEYEEELQRDEQQCAYYIVDDIK